MADRNLSSRNPLPVLRWLRVGATAAGIGMALAAAPGIASADDGTATSASEAPKPAGPHRSAAAVKRTPAPTASAANRNRTRTAAPVGVGTAAGSAKPAAVTHPAAAPRRVAAAASTPLPTALPATLAASAATAPVSSRLGVGASPAGAGPAASPGTTPTEKFMSALNAAVDTFSIGLRNLLAAPGTPAEFIQAALLLVDRSFFDDTPIARAGADVYRASGTLEGSLVDNDEGDPLNVTLALAPLYGTVEITEDGKYVYTPGDGYSGTDSFTVHVTDPGFSLSAPTAARVQPVTVSVGPPNVGSGTNGYFIFNFTDRTMKVVGVKGTDYTGTQQPVEGDQVPTVGTMLTPGDWLHLSLDSPYWRPQYVDVTVESLPDQSKGWFANTWNVHIASGGSSSVLTTSSCTTDNCVYSDWDKTLLIIPGTSYTFTQDNPTGQALLNGLLQADEMLATSLNISYANAAFGKKALEFKATDLSYLNGDGSEGTNRSKTVKEPTKATQSSSWQLTGSAGGTLGVVDLAVAAQYNSGTTTVTDREFSTTTTIYPRPYSYDVLMAATPEINVTGDLVATIGACTEPRCTKTVAGGTFTFRGVDYTYPDPSPNATLKYFERLEPYQDHSQPEMGANQGFKIQDGRAVTNPAFPDDPVYSLHDPKILEEGGFQLRTRAYVGATVATAEDWTRFATYTVSDPTIASVTASGKLIPLKAGTTRITATYAWAIPGDLSGDVRAYMDITVVE